jgi:hypothetical protein
MGNKEKKPTEKKEKEQYKEGDALEGTVPNFDAINFKNRDVMKWTELSGGRQKQTPVSVQGLATLANKTKLPRYNKK